MYMHLRGDYESVADLEAATSIKLMPLHASRPSKRRRVNGKGLPNASIITEPIVFSTVAPLSMGAPNFLLAHGLTHTPKNHQ